MIISKVFFWKFISLPQDHCLKIEHDHNIGIFGRLQVTKERYIDLEKSIKNRPIG